MNVPRVAPQCDRGGCSVFGTCVMGAVPGGATELSWQVRKVRMVAGTGVFHQGTPQAGLVILCAGRVRLSHVLVTGKSVLLRLCGPGELLSVPMLATHPYSCQTEGQAWLTTIDCAAAGRLTAADARFTLALVEKLAEQTSRYVERMVTLASAGARARLASVLSSLHGEAQGVHQAAASLEISAKDLGQMAGCSRQTASSWLREMERAGIISRKRREVKLLQPELLVSLSLRPS